MGKRVFVLLVLSLLLTGCSQGIPNQQSPPSVSQPIQTKSLVQQVKESTHYKLGIDCQVCHSLGGKEMISLNNPGWESCGSCHTNQYAMIKGTGIGEVPDFISLKYRLGDKFTCYDCHLTDGTRHSFSVPGSSRADNDTSGLETKFDHKEFKTLLQTDKCAMCHIEPDATIDQLSRQREEIEQKLKSLRPIYDEWEAKVTSLDPADPQVKAFNEGRTYLTKVEADGSKGAHNYELALALLNKAIDKFSILK